MEKEIWKTIPNFSKYEASSLGRVRSLNYKRSGRVQVLKPSDNGNSGYFKTMLLRDDGIYNTRPIHRLVASAFFGDRKELTVNHKDGNKANNNINNLEWCTRSENVKHAFKTGLMIPKRGELNGMSKLTKEKVEYARELARTKGRFWGRNKLALEWGVNPKHLQRIVNKSESWK